LQLFSYDYYKKEESEVSIEGKEYILNEVTRSADGIDDEVTCLNVIFSEEFGTQPVLYRDEKHFLDSQYLVAQEYIENQEHASFAVYSLKDLEAPLFE
jgi:hypothetical protein